MIVAFIRIEKSWRTMNIDAAGANCAGAVSYGIIRVCPVAAAPKGTFHIYAGVCLSLYPNSVTSPNGALSCVFMPRIDSGGGAEAGKTRTDCKVI